jgi:hypothetical protein
MQKAVVNAVEKALVSDTAAQAVIADAIKDEVNAGFPVAADTVQGKVALNLGNTLPGDFTNSVDALTSSGVNTMLNDTSVAGGNPMQKAVVNAMEAAIAADTGAQTALANSIKEEVASAILGDPATLASLTDGLRYATTDVPGLVTLANEADAPSTSDTEVVTPKYLTKVMDDALDAAALEAATDTVQGKVALNLGTALPGDFANSVDALTSTGVSTMLNDTSVAGGNPLQKAVVNAMEAAIAADTGAQTALANSIKEEVAAAITGDPAVMATLADGFRSATDTAKGVVTLAVAANHPSTSDVEATTPAYVNTAITASAIATKVTQGTNVTITGLGTTASPLVINSTADVKDTLATGNKIGIVDSVVLNETITTVLPKATGKGYTFTKEDATQNSIDPANFKSDDAGQSLSVGSDGGLFVNVIAMLPESVNLTGSNNGDVEITLTPDITDPNQLTVEANLKVAATSPTSTVNLLKFSPSGYYVSGEEISDTINDSPAATDTLMNAVVDALIADPTKLQELANALSGLLPDAFDA